MSLREEVTEIRERGMLRAAELWEKLENLPVPTEPVNIFKATCSLKCAEFITRVRDSQMFEGIMGALAEFIDGTLEIADSMPDEGTREEGERILAIYELDMPLTAEVFKDPSAYAERQHTYDGIIMLAGAKMGKAEETKKQLETLQQNVARTMMLAILGESIANLITKDPS